MKFLNDLARPIKPGLPKQIIRIMKLTAIIMTTVLLQLSAATYSQQVTLKADRIRLEKVFSEIRKQTGYTVLCKYEDIKDIPPQKISLQNIPIDQAFERILKDKGLEYQISDKAVTIRKKQPTLIDKIINLFDNIDINGKVTDEQNQPLPGATIKIKGTNQTYTTDQNGNFYIQNVDEKAILVISYIGYGQKEIKAEKNPTITLKMISGDLNQVEIVNKGYYTTTKELNTGNIAKVSAEDIQNQPVSNPLLAIAGRVAGLQVRQVTGEPGGDVGILIRGENSLANGRDPLYVIDNVPLLTSIAVAAPMNVFNTINPMDIESIEILKDADATAIYGARGANGVILITTKKGKASGTRIDASTNVGWGASTKDMSLLNTTQYLMMRREAYKNDGMPIPDQSTPIGDRNPSNYDLTAWDPNKYTDWQKVIIGNTSHYTDANATLSGGSDNTKFSLASNFHKETTITPGDFSYQRTNLRFNLNHSSLDRKFKADFSAFYSDNNNRTVAAQLLTNIFLAPNAPELYKSDGSLNWENSTWTNPLAAIIPVKKVGMGNANGNLNLSYELLPGLELKTNAGFGKLTWKSMILTPLSSFDPANIYAQASTRYDDGSTSSWNIEPQVSYKLGIGKGHFEALTGMTFSEQISNNLEQLGTGFTSDALLENRRAASALSTDQNDYSQYRYTSIYGRLSYDYARKYVLNLTARRDGSSRFGPGKKFGNFGAVGAAWVFSKEDFVTSSLSFLSFGKLRLSYGITGNDQIGDYQYLSLYYPYSATYQGVSPVTGGGATNPNYAWETNKKAEIGLELGFLKDRIGITASAFRNRSSNQLLTTPLPTITGSDRIVANLPAIVQNTGLEFTLHSINLKAGKFSWASDFNLTIARNKLVDYPGLENSAYRTTFFVGKSLNTRPLYQYKGVDSQTGLYTVVDFNGDGIINAANDRKATVDQSQQFYGGFQNSVQFGQWKLDFFFQFVKQNYGLNYYGASSTNVPGTANLNVPDFILKRWQKPGDVTDVQKFSNSGDAANAYYNMIGSTLIYSDASYIRLKNISLAYSLPTKLTKAIKASNLSVFVQGQNIFTITNYFGLDPETQGSLPPVKNLTVGGRISF